MNLGKNSYYLKTHTFLLNISSKLYNTQLHKCAFTVTDFNNKVSIC